MTKGKSHIVVPQTVLQIMEQFAAAMRADPDVQDDAIGRLEALLHEGTVPKPDDINAALFEGPMDGER